MDISLTLIRSLFFLLCVILATIYTSSTSAEGATPITLLIGVISGSIFGTALIGLDTMLRRFNLRSFNIAIMGMFLGYLLGQAFLLILTSALDINNLSINPHALTLIKSSILLGTIYIGMVMTARAANEMYISLPFIKLKSTSLKKRDIILDPSVLKDPRIIDLSSSGLLDNHLILPRFVLTELHANVEKGDDAQRARARKSLEVIRKLETQPKLELRYTDTDIPEAKEPFEKMVKLARLVGANIITADVNQIQQASVEDVRVINFQQLCNALRPLSQSGEFIEIKIQRYGKEPRQGVGYLDDGTMVVVNGGAEYIGDTVNVQVLSVKHTSSGRMIFSNAIEEETCHEEESHEQYVTQSERNQYTYQ